MQEAFEDATTGRPGPVLIDIPKDIQFAKSSYSKPKKEKKLNGKIHNKFSEKPLDELLKNAWSFISLQSTAGFKAMVNGIPAYFTENSLKNINRIEDLENPKINYKIFNNLAYGQWTLKEIESGEACNIISNIK